MRSGESRLRPTSWQVRRTRLAVKWYLQHHHGTSGDPGTQQMYFDPQRVGLLAVRPEELRLGKPAALFRVLVATAMFQRQRDAQVIRILRDLPPATAREIGSLARLEGLAEKSPCPHLGSNATLISKCDLSKSPATRRGECASHPDLACHLKRHTEALRRYGHFGKVPTSIALAIGAAGARDLRALYRQVLRAAASPLDASLRLEASLSGAWRVNQKIACMFLSVVSNPDLGGGATPWSAGLDWNHFVVVDSNVDLFLNRIGYAGNKTYEARRSFVQALARRVDLSELKPGLAEYNARLVQQALYLFMSASNRRLMPNDCSHLGADSCDKCPGPLRTICPLRSRVVSSVSG